MLVAWDDEQAARCQDSPRRPRPMATNAPRSSIGTRCYDCEPHLGPGATGGMLVPDEHIIDPWSTPLAFAYRGDRQRCCRVRESRGDRLRRRQRHHHDHHCRQGRSIRTRFVVNAAGLHGDELHRSLGLDGFTIRPRRGELIVFDKLARPLLNRTVLPVPTSHTKGVLVAPTVFGNVMLGPTADDIDDKSRDRIDRAGIDGLLREGTTDPSCSARRGGHVGVRGSPRRHRALRLPDQPPTSRCATCASAAFARRDSLHRWRLPRRRWRDCIDCGLTATRKESVESIRMTPLGEAGERPYQRGGQIVCHCERVTVGEVTAACAAPVPAVDFDGLRRRTRALAGRCQGFYCQAELCNLTGWSVAP